jgi:site-specific DNA recombinase
MSVTKDQATDIGPLTAVIYLRVSTPGQVRRALNPEGYSLPGQRAACKRLAADLGATVIAEYVEPGRTGTNTRRPALQRMLAELDTLKPNFVIFYDLSRSARDEFDAYWLWNEIKHSGAIMKSTQEDFDDSDDGMMRFGIHTILNAHPSRNDGKKVKIGVARKHEEGGSHGPTRLGYLNTRLEIDGRQVASIGLDGERAPLIRVLFELAATGQHTIASLEDLMYEAGLRTRSTPTRPACRVGHSRLHRILRNDYYIGVVTQNGVKVQGRHEAIVDKATFEKVQAVLHAHRAGGERSKKHQHYLNGSLFCRVCGARLGYGNHRAKLGGYYDYYSCLSRVRPTGPCGNPYAPVSSTEQAVAEIHASRPWLTPTEQQAVREAVRKFVDSKAEHAQAEADRHERRLRELTGQQQKLVQLYYREAISIDLLQTEQQRIEQERAQATAWHTQAVAQVDDAMDALDDALTLLAEPGKAYDEADHSLKKMLNRAVFARILIQVIDRRIEAQGLSHEVFEQLVALANQLGLAPDAPPDAEVPIHAGHSRRRTRTRASRNEPQPVLQGPGFARRTNDGERGIRTLGGP